MKTRSDFVSNSSSSSFIVINDSGKYADRMPQSGETVVFPCENGEMEFGWQTEIYSDMWSKLNWCALVALEYKDMEKGYSSADTMKVDISCPWRKFSAMSRLFRKVCARLGIDGKIGMRSVGYIDHQSSVGESPENARMFQTEKTLYDFVANGDSYIDNSNDNGGRDDLPHPYVQPDDYSGRTWRAGA